MVMLVTLDRAKTQEYLTHSHDDAEIARKIAEASDIVLDYIDKPEITDDWTDENVPGVVSAAVLLVFGALWENRAGRDDAPDPISDAVKNLLRRWRDPVLA